MATLKRVYQKVFEIGLKGLKEKALWGCHSAFVV